MAALSKAQCTGIHWYPLVPIWLYVCYTDWRHRRIDNWVVVYLVLVGLVAQQLAGVAMLPAATQSALVLSVGYLAWRLDIIGAGDAKLFFGLSFWHAGEVLVLAFHMVLAGAVLALPYLALRISGTDSKRMAARGIPYGVAIVIASASLKI